MPENNKNLSEQDYLKMHLQGLENNSTNNEQQSTDSSIQYIESTTVDSLKYFSFDVKDLPCGIFYPVGTLLQVRPCNVVEIQSYSMVDDNNIFDVIEKMNDMLKACVRVKYPDNKIASYLDIKDQDRIFLIFLIRELTFQAGNSLKVTAKGSDDEDVIIELKRANFIFHDIGDKYNKYFNTQSRSYKFKIKNGKNYEITPPTIGLQKAFSDYIIKENSEKKAPNGSFLKIIPFMLGGRNSITEEGIKAKLEEFKNLDEMSFQFLNDIISKLTFGIKELRGYDSCGLEVRTKMQFPNGIAGIFIIQDAFDTYIEE